MEFAEGFVAVAIARCRASRRSCRIRFPAPRLADQLPQRLWPLRPWPKRRPACRRLGLARLRCVGRPRRALAGCGLQCGKRVRLRRTGFRCGGGEDKRLNDRDGGRLRGGHGRRGRIDEHGVERGGLNRLPLSVCRRQPWDPWRLSWRWRSCRPSRLWPVSHRRSCHPPFWRPCCCWRPGRPWRRIVVRRLGLGMAVVRRLRLVGAVGPVQAFGRAVRGGGVGSAAGAGLSSRSANGLASAFE